MAVRAPRPGVFLLAVHGRGPRAGVLGFLFGLAFFIPHVAWSGIYVGAMPWLALATLESLYVEPHNRFWITLRAWPMPSVCAGRIDTACGMAPPEHWANFKEWSRARQVTVASRSSRESGFS